MFGGYGNIVKSDYKKPFKIFFEKFVEIFRNILFRNNSSYHFFHKNSSKLIDLLETHFVYNKPKLVKSIGNKYKRKALNMLSKNMIVNRVPYPILIHSISLMLEILTNVFLVILLS
jgi:hypothetical protein